MKTFNPELLKKMLADRDWTAGQLHREIWVKYHDAGISRQGVYGWLTGEVAPSAINLARLSDLLGVTIDEMFSEQTEKENDDDRGKSQPQDG